MKTVLQRATFNREKCQFTQDQMEFFGYTLTKGGLTPSPDKLKAIQECRALEDKETVCSFLGMAEYLDNFIENYAT